MKITYFFSLFWIIFFQPAYCQDSINSYQIAALKSTEKITIDGELNEPIWKNTFQARDFYQKFPYDTSFAHIKTEAMVSYDDHFLYIGAICYEEDGARHISQSLRRDFNPDMNDCFLITVDPFGDKTNGFSFGTTAMGVQYEGLIINGNELALDWDNKWFSEVKRQDDRYTVEMAIPFKTLRFKPENKQWGINFIRIDKKVNETSTWKPVPRNFSGLSLAFVGDLTWREALPATGTNVSVIPYLAGQTSRNQLAGTPQKYAGGAGADVKVAVTSALNLDLTFNPDFSQVEVDRQVTNLDRFEIFFPERRQFFLENQDLFARFGFSRIRPFFSRRIGIGRDTTTGLIVQNPILYGARLSGKLDKNWRVGFLNMQTGKVAEKGIEGQNFTVATFQRQIFGRSNFGGIVVNRARTSTASEGFTLTSGDFTRVVGLDYNLLSKDNKWQGKFFFHQLLTPIQKADQYAHASYVQYATPNVRISWNHEYVGKNYNPNDVGFVPRRDHWRLEPGGTYRFYPKKKGAKINNHGPETYHNLFWTTAGKLTDRFNEVGYYAVYNNSAFVGIWYANSYIYLRDSFDPSGRGSKTDTLPANTGYTTNRLEINYRTNNRRKVYGGFNGTVGQYYNGNLITFNGDATFLLKYYGAFAMTFNYTQLLLPKPWGNSGFWLVGPRLDLTVTRNIFLTVFTQYNLQADNVNVNARLQWRFKPVSDIFLVYTDNYFAETFKVKNRALVLKMTYWLNL
jgi:hypothetical protein